MPLFRYMGIDASGALVKGTIEAATPELAWRNAELATSHLLEVRETKSILAPILNQLDARRLGRQPVIEFAGNLAVMLQAGIPIIGALSDLAESAENSYFARKIEGIRGAVAMGSSFSAAISAHDDLFPDIFIRLVSVGEETGNLDGSLRDAAEHLQRVEDLSSAMKSALIYPAFAFVSAIGALFFWMLYVLPKIITLFQDMKVTLPPVTRFLIAASFFTQNFWPLFLIMPVALFVIVKLGSRNERFRFLFDRLKLATPVLGLILENRALGTLSEQMRILTRAGMTIDRSLSLATEVMGNRVYRRALYMIRQEVLAGSTISEAMQRERVFPPMLLRMVHIGENSGTLEKQFAFLSQHYVKKLEQISQRLGKMLEPIIIIFLGILFAVIIIGLLLPIYDLISNVGRM